MSAADRWLAVIGVGDDGLDGLAPAARALVDGAEVLVGGARHLAMLPDDGPERVAWPSPLAQALDEIEARRGRRVCVIATGDPMWFGVGATLARRFPPEEMLVLPSPSAFSLAAARLGWPLAETACLTLHGRPLELVHPHVQPGARLLILSEDGTTPGRLARLLCARGFAASRLTVLEHMGGAAESRIEATADEWQGRAVADLNTVAVACAAGPDARILPAVPGLPDDAFEHDGQLTKREVRAATLAALGPGPRAHLWDVGAGCGSVAVEWLRAAPSARAIAVEREPDRCARIARNACALGAPQLAVVEGEAPGALDGLDPPDAVFVGGGLSTEGLFEACWRALAPGGRLVANAVTVEGEARLAELRETHGGDLVRIAVSRAQPVGPFLGWKPLMTVTQWQAVRG